MDSWDLARSLDKDKHETVLLLEVNFPFQVHWTGRIQDWTTSNYEGVTGLEDIVILWHSTRVGCVDREEKQHVANSSSYILGYALRWTHISLL